jgi:hypothetical protein
MRGTVSMSALLLAGPQGQEFFMSPTFAALMALLLPGAALAQGYNREDIVRGLCQKDGCDEFVIVEKKPVAEKPDGALYSTRVRAFHASHQGRVDRGEENGFVYCSPTKPAILATQEGQPPTAFLLAPYSQDPAYEQRKSTNFYALYFALCHGLEAGKAAGRDRQGVARSFNYRVSLTQPKTVTLKRVEDIFDPPAGG